MNATACPNHDTLEAYLLGNLDNGAIDAHLDACTDCQAALDGAHVNLVPGSAFGAEGYVRLSFAASRELLNTGLDRFEQWLKKG